MPIPLGKQSNISVVIPAYKARDYLPDCLESIGRQTLLPKEILVIDDASPEPVDDIVAWFSSRPGYPPIRLVRHEVNRGQAAGRNTGIQASSGVWLAFIDSDDIWAPDHLEQAMTTLQSTGADLAFCPATIFKKVIHEKNPFIERPMTQEEESLAPLALLKRNFIIMSSVVATAASIRRIGGFDEDEKMRAVEDLDCFMKLLKNGATFVMSEKSTLFYRKHPESATCRKGYMVRQVVHVTERHLGWPEGTCASKRRILADTYWRAATLTFQLGAPDRRYWFLKAIQASCSEPTLLVRRFAKFLKNTVMLCRTQRP